MTTRSGNLLSKKFGSLGGAVPDVQLLHNARQARQSDIDSTVDTKRRLRVEAISPCREGLVKKRTNEQAEPSSLCLLSMVDAYIEQEGGAEERSCAAGCVVRSEGINSDDRHVVHSKANCIPEFDGTIQEITSILRKEDADEITLSMNVANAVDEAEKEAFFVFRHQQRMACTDAFLRRSVMKHLRLFGYDAGICKSTRDCVGGFPQDEHEYIDVLQGKAHAKQQRFFIELRFRAQFKIARPSSAYTDLLHALPKVFVGKAGALRRIVKLMSDATTLSLERQGMEVPPWRRRSFMEAKWFSRHTRTTDTRITEARITEQASRTAVLGRKEVGGEAEGKKGSRGAMAAISEGRNERRVMEGGSMMKERWQPPPKSGNRGRKMRAEKVAGALAMAMVEASLNAKEKSMARLQLQQKLIATIVV